MLVSLLVRSFIRSFVRSFVCSSVPPSVRSFVRSFIPSFLHSFFRSFVPLFVCSFVRLFVSSFQFPNVTQFFLLDINYLAALSLDFLDLKESVVPTECLRYAKVARCLTLFEGKENEFDAQSRPLFLIYSFRHSQSS